MKGLRFTVQTDLHRKKHGTSQKTYPSGQITEQVDKDARELTAASFRGTGP